MRKSFLAILVLLLALPLVADEGMWLFNRTPNAIFKQRYGFEPTKAWLDHLQKSSIRFNSGGSGSFVSADGLALTNHHVGLDCLAKISTKDHDYVTTGYYAKTQADEVKCVDLELNVLQSIEDVTAKVNAAVTPGMTTAAAQAARRGVMSTIEQESVKATGLRSDVVTLFQGGEYHLYRYKKYTDVRLVFAPEVAAAFYGGDPDNFEYPRYDLDICFFRAYENGKAVRPTDWLAWNASGPKDGDLIFMSGNPASTSRLNTLHHLEFYRDIAYPFNLTLLQRREVLLNTYAERSAENERRAHDDLFGIKNSRKVYVGRIAGLQDPAVMQRKTQSETALQQKIAADPQLQSAYGDAWQQVDNALATYREIYVPYRLLENTTGFGLAFNSHLFSIAREVLRLQEESKKPNAERLREYRESNLESLQQEIYSEAPIYDDLEILELGDSLSMWMQYAPNDPLLMQLLNGKSPNQRAAELVQGTKLKSVAARKSPSPDDPMIAAARLVDARARELRQRYENDVQEPLRQAYAKIANAVFKTSGGETYPDATFTLRLSFGTVKGYEENGKQIPAFTTMAGAFTRSADHDNQPPYNLPKSWFTHKAQLKLDTPYDFVSTADIIGGNSGSPVVNRANEFVGIVFDGNLQSLPWDYQFDDRQGRALSVDSAAILEALRHIYNATNVVDELSKK
ncbi:MAG: S46 family peptidase [Acidobacteria bacterium]|nr:S46 family peptidase [Acidobacteriota bacterium]